MINTTKFLSWMAMFHVSPLMECIFLNSKDLLECVVMKKRPVALVHIAWSTLAQLMIFICSRFLVMLFCSQGISICHATIVFIKSSSSLLHSIKRDLFIYHDDSLTSQRVIMQTEQPTKCFVSLQKLRVRLGPLN